MKIPKRFMHAKNGEWQQPQPIHHMRCCDCGLVHRLEFRLYKNRVQYRAYRVKTKGRP